MKNINSVVRAFDWIELVSSVLIIICFFLPYAAGISPVSFTFFGFLGKPDLQIVILIGVPMILFLLFPVLVIFKGRVKVKIPGTILIIALIIVLIAYYIFYLFPSFGNKSIMLILPSFLIMFAIFACGLIIKGTVNIYKSFLLSVLSVPVFLNFIELFDNIDFGGVILSISMIILVITLFLKLVLRNYFKELTA